MNNLILVRHSEPEIKPAKPASTWRLSERGRTRAGELAEELRGFSPASIWGSKEPKAIETAQILAGALHLSVNIADGLEEHHRCNVPYFPTQDEFEQAIEQFFLNSQELVLGDETAHQVLQRFTAAIGRIIATDTAETPIVVTHGTVMTLYTASVSGVEPMRFWRNLETPDLDALIQAYNGHIRVYTGILPQELREYRASLTVKREVYGS